MKKLMLLAAMLAMVLVAAAPIIAQEVGFDDQELESGSYESETSISIEEIRLIPSYPLGAGPRRGARLPV